MSNIDRTGGQKDLWLNGKKYKLKDLKDINLNELTNQKLKKFIKLFDSNDSKTIENRYVNGKNEWESIFSELQQASGDNNLTNEEFELYISKKLPDTDLKMEDLNELLEVASKKPENNTLGKLQNEIKQRAEEHNKYIEAEKEKRRDAELKKINKEARKILVTSKTEKKELDKNYEDIFAYTKEKLSKNGKEPTIDEINLYAIELQNLNPNINPREKIKKGTSIILPGERLKKEYIELLESKGINIVEENILFFQKLVNLDEKQQSKIFNAINESKSKSKEDLINEVYTRTKTNLSDTGLTIKVGNSSSTLEYFITQKLGLSLSSKDGLKIYQRLCSLGENKASIQKSIDKLPKDFINNLNSKNMTFDKFADKAEVFGIILRTDNEIKEREKNSQEYRDIKARMFIANYAAESYSAATASSKNADRERSVIEGAYWIRKARPAGFTSKDDQRRNTEKAEKLKSLALEAATLSNEEFGKKMNDIMEAKRTAFAPGVAGAPATSATFNLKDSSFNFDPKLVNIFKQQLQDAELATAVNLRLLPHRKENSSNNSVPQESTRVHNTQKELAAATQYTVEPLNEKDLEQLKLYIKAINTKKELFLLAKSLHYTSDVITKELKTMVPKEKQEEISKLLAEKAKKLGFIKSKDPKHLSATTFENIFTSPISKKVKYPQTNDKTLAETFKATKTKLLGKWDPAGEEASLQKLEQMAGGVIDIGTMIIGTGYLGSLSKIMKIGKVGETVGTMTNFFKTSSMAARFTENAAIINRLAKFDKVAGGLWIQGARGAFHGTANMGLYGGAQGAVSIANNVYENIKEGKHWADGLDDRTMQAIFMGIENGKFGFFAGYSGVLAHALGKGTTILGAKGIDKLFKTNYSKTVLDKVSSVVTEEGISGSEFWTKMHAASKAEGLIGFGYETGFFTLYHKLEEAGVDFNDEEALIAGIEANLDEETKESLGETYLSEGGNLAMFKFIGSLIQWVRIGKLSASAAMELQVNKNRALKNMHMRKVIENGKESYIVKFNENDKPIQCAPEQLMQLCEHKMFCADAEDRAQKDGSFKLPNNQTIEYDNTKKVYRTVIDSENTIEAESVEKLLVKNNQYAFAKEIEKHIEDKKEPYILNENQKITKGPDGIYRLVIIDENGIERVYRTDAVENFFKIGTEYDVDEKTGTLVKKSAKEGESTADINDNQHLSESMTMQAIGSETASPRSAVPTNNRIPYIEPLVKRANSGQYTFKTYEYPNGDVETTCINKNTGKSEIQFIQYKNGTMDAFEITQENGLTVCKDAQGKVVPHKFVTQGNEYEVTIAVEKYSTTEGRANFNNIPDEVRPDVLSTKADKAVSTKKTKKAPKTKTVEKLLDLNEIQRADESFLAEYGFEKDPDSFHRDGTYYITKYPNGRMFQRLLLGNDGNIIQIEAHSEKGSLVYTQNNFTEIDMGIQTEVYNKPAYKKLQSGPIEIKLPSTKKPAKSKPAKPANPTESAQPESTETSNQTGKMRISITEKNRASVENMVKNGVAKILPDGTAELDFAAMHKAGQARINTMQANIGRNMSEVAGFDVLGTIEKLDASIVGSPSVQEFGNGNRLLKYYNSDGKVVKITSQNENGSSETSYMPTKDTPDITIYTDNQGKNYAFIIDENGAKPVVADGNGNSTTFNQINELRDQASTAPKPESAPEARSIEDAVTVEITDENNLPNRTDVQAAINDAVEAHRSGQTETVDLSGLRDQMNEPLLSQANEPVPKGGFWSRLFGKGKNTPKVPDDAPVTGENLKTALNLKEVDLGEYAEGWKSTANEGETFTSYYSKTTGGKILYGVYTDGSGKVTRVKVIDLDTRIVSNIVNQSNLMGKYSTSVTDTANSYINKTVTEIGKGKLIKIPEEDGFRAIVEDENRKLLLEYKVDKDGNVSIIGRNYAEKDVSQTIGELKQAIEQGDGVKTTALTVELEAKGYKVKQTENSLLITPPKDKPLYVGNVTKYETGTITQMDGTDGKHITIIKDANDKTLIKTEGKELFSGSSESQLSPTLDLRKTGVVTEDLLTELGFKKNSEDPGHRYYESEYPNGERRQWIKVNDQGIIERSTVWDESGAVTNQTRIGNNIETKTAKYVRKNGEIQVEGQSESIDPAPTKPTGSSVHSKILNKEFGTLETKSPEEVTKMITDYAAENGLKLIQGTDMMGRPTFSLRDANGNEVREIHTGLDGQGWYDHHQVFNSDNKLTNRFVVRKDGKLQSTVEYLYDKDGNFKMSFGYGGKAGIDVNVFTPNDNGTMNRRTLTIHDFIEENGFEPTYYREIIPEAADLLPMETNTIPPEAKAAIMEAATNSNYDPTVVESFINTNPKIVNKLIQAKGTDGQPLLDSQGVSDVIANCREILQENPQKLDAILEKGQNSTSIITELIKIRLQKGFGISEHFDDALEHILNGKFELSLDKDGAIDCIDRNTNLKKFHVNFKENMISNLVYDSNGVKEVHTMTPDGMVGILDMRTLQVQHVQNTLPEIQGKTETSNKPTSHPEAAKHKTYNIPESSKELKAAVRDLAEDGLMRQDYAEAVDAISGPEGLQRMLDQAKTEREALYISTRFKNSEHPELREIAQKAKELAENLPKDLQEAGVITPTLNAKMTRYVEERIEKQLMRADFAEKVKNTPADTKAIEQLIEEAQTFDEADFVGRRFKYVQDLKIQELVTKASKKAAKMFNEGKFKTGVNDGVNGVNESATPRPAESTAKVDVSAELTEKGVQIDPDGIFLGSEPQPHVVNSATIKVKYNGNEYEIEWYDIFDNEAEIQSALLDVTKGKVNPNCKIYDSNGNQVTNPFTGKPEIINERTPINLNTDAAQQRRRMAMQGLRLSRTGLQPKQSTSRPEAAKESVNDIYNRVTSQEGVTLESTQPTLNGAFETYVDSEGKPILGVQRDLNNKIISVKEGEYINGELTRTTKTWAEGAERGYDGVQLPEDIEEVYKYSCDSSETNPLQDGNGTRTDYKRGGKPVLTVIKDNSGKIVTALENIYQGDELVRTHETQADGTVITNHSPKVEVTPSQSSTSVERAKSDPQKTATYLGKSIKEPSFPTEFNMEDFKIWADENGLTLELDHGTALFKDSLGRTVRRITNDINRKGYIYDDRIHYYVGKTDIINISMIKYHDESPALSYDRISGQPKRAHLKSDGNWYDPTTNIMLERNPVTGKPQELNGNFKLQRESLAATEFPTEINESTISSLKDWAKAQKWAGENGLQVEIGKESIVMKDSNGNTVRQINLDYRDTSKVFEDRVYIFEDNTRVGQILKRHDIGETRYFDGINQDDIYVLGKDGLWYNRQTADVSPINPITKTPQRTGAGVNGANGVNEGLNPSSVEGARPRPATQAELDAHIKSLDAQTGYISLQDRITNLHQSGSTYIQGTNSNGNIEIRVPVGGKTSSILGFDTTKYDVYEFKNGKCVEKRENVSARKLDKLIGQETVKPKTVVMPRLEGDLLSQADEPASRSQRKQIEKLVSPELKAEWEKYATDNGYEMSFTQSGNVVFRNSEGRIVRRIDLDSNAQVKGDKTFPEAIQTAATKSPEQVLADIAKNCGEPEVKNLISETIEIYKDSNGNEVAVVLKDKTSGQIKGMQVAEYDPQNPTKNPKKVSKYGEKSNRISVSRASAKEIQEFSDWLEAQDIEPNDKQALMNSFKRHPDGVNALIDTDIVSRPYEETSQVTDLAPCMESNPKECTRLLHLKDTQGNYMLYHDDIPALVETEAKYPGITEQILNDRVLLQEIGKFKLIENIPDIAEAYLAKAPLVRMIASKINYTKSTIPLHDLAKVSINNPEGVLKFINDSNFIKYNTWLDSKKIPYELTTNEEKAQFAEKVAKDWDRIIKNHEENPEEFNKLIDNRYNLEDASNIMDAKKINEKLTDALMLNKDNKSSDILALVKTEKTLPPKQKAPEIPADTKAAEETEPVQQEETSTTPKMSSEEMETILKDAIKDCRGPLEENNPFFGIRETYLDKNGNVAVVVLRSRNGKISGMEIAKYQTERPDVTVYGDTNERILIQRAGKTEIAELEELLKKRLDRLVGTYSPEDKAILDKYLKLSEGREREKYLDNLRYRDADDTIRHQYKVIARYVRSKIGHEDYIEACKKHPEGVEALLEFAKQEKISLSDFDYRILAGTMETNPNECKRLLKIKDRAPVTHEYSVGHGLYRQSINHEFALHPETIADVVKTEAKFPGVIEKIVKDGFLNPKQLSASRLNAIAEAYSKDPALVKFIYTEEGPSSIPREKLCQASVEEHDAVENFVHDDKLYVDKYTSDYRFYEHSSDTLNDAMHYYGKDSKLFNEICNDEIKNDSGYSVKRWFIEEIPTIMKANEISPKITEILRKSPKVNYAHNILDFVEATKDCQRGAKLLLALTKEKKCSLTDLIKDSPKKLESLKFDLELYQIQDLAPKVEANYDRAVQLLKKHPDITWEQFTSVLL